MHDGTCAVSPKRRQHMHPNSNMGRNQRSWGRKGERNRHKKRAEDLTLASLLFTFHFVLRRFDARTFAWAMVTTTLGTAHAVSCLGILPRVYIKFMRHATPGLFFLFQPTFSHIDIFSFVLRSKCICWAISVSSRRISKDVQRRAPLTS